jgi:hypothetical protein
MSNLKSNGGFFFVLVLYMGEILSACSNKNMLHKSFFCRPTLSTKDLGKVSNGSKIH